MISSYKEDNMDNTITLRDFALKLRELFPFRYLALDEMGLCLSLSKPVWAEWGWKRPDDASDAIFIVNSTNDDFPLPENLDLSEYVSDGYTIYRKCIVDLGA